MRDRHRLMPRKDRALRDRIRQMSAERSNTFKPRTRRRLSSPVIELEAWPPVGRSEQSLDSAGQIHKHVAHEKKPTRETQAAQFKAVLLNQPTFKIGFTIAFTVVNSSNLYHATEFTRKATVNCSMLY